MPIIVGVDWKKGHTGNVDKTADQWVIIIGKGSDDKGNYYSYYDPQTSQKNIGTSDENKLYLQNDGMIKGRYREGSIYDRIYTVTIIRPSFEL